MASDESDKAKAQKTGLFGRLFGRGETPAAEEVPAPVPVAEPKRSWWERLRGGLARSSSALGQGIADVFTKRKLDAAMLDELEDILIQADLGVTWRRASAMPSARDVSTATSIRRR
jgi:fused signal recognition particle receptor